MREEVITVGKFSQKNYPSEHHLEKFAVVVGRARVNVVEDMKLRTAGELKPGRFSNLTPF